MTQYKANSLETYVLLQNRSMKHRRISKDGVNVLLPLVITISKR
jgi:hypothetical protein